MEESTGIANDIQSVRQTMNIDSGEIILICFIFLIMMIYIASCSKEAAIVIASFTALIVYLLNLKNKSNFGCVNYNNGARQEEEALKLLGASGKEGYMDYDHNLLTDYASEPYMVSPSEVKLQERAIRQGIPITDKEFTHKLKKGVLTYEDLDLDYPGAIELDQIESDDYLWMGHVDAKEVKNSYKMRGDVTFDLNRTKGNDDIPSEWSNDAVLDGDEQITNSNRSRALNANVRSDMGVIRRKEFMERFVADELNETEDRIWYSKADY